MEIDKLIFSLDADLSPLRRRYQEAEQLAQQAGRKVGDAFGTQSAGTQATQRNIESYTQTLNKASDATEKYGQTSNRAIAGAAKEFRILFAELSEGNVFRASGTLTKIASHMLPISAGAFAAGAAIAGIGLAAVYASDKGSQSFRDLEKAIRATGNSAGLTLDQVSAAAKELSQHGEYSTIGARNAIGLASRGGKVSGQTAIGIAGLAPDFARANGMENSEEAIKKLSEIFNKPAEGAKALADQFNLLNVQQVREVETLVAQGRSQEAQKVLLDSLNGRFKGLNEQSMGLFEKAIHAVTTAAGNAAEALGKFTRELTTQEQIDRIKARQQADAEMRAEGGNTGLGNRAAVARGPGTTALQMQLGQLLDDREWEEAVARGKAIEAANDQLARSALEVAKGYETSADRARKYADDAALLARALPVLQEKFPELAAEVAKAADAALIASKNQRSAADMEIAALNEQAAAYKMTANAREQFLAKGAVERQYQADLADPGKARDAGRLRQERLDALGARRQSQFDDPLGRQGTLGDAQFANEQSRRMLGGSSRGVAEGNEARRINEAQAATRGMREAATTEEEAQKVKELTDKLEAEYAVRDRIAQQIRATDEQRGLSQALQEKQLELSLMEKSEVLRAKELADLRLRNQLISEGYEIGSKAYTDEYEKRAKVVEKIAETDVAINKAKRAQEQWQQAANDFTHIIGGQFENAALKGGKMRDIVKALEEDLAKLILRVAVTKPMENALLAAMGADKGGGGSMGGLMSSAGSWFSSLFPSGASSYSTAGAGSVGLNGMLGHAAAGGPIRGPTIVGETGPEIFNPDGPGTIMPADQTRRMMGGSSPSISIIQQISIAPDVSAIARAQVMMMMPTIKDYAVSGVEQAVSRGELALGSAR